MRRKPWLWLLAGPNGAGKSTYAPKLRGDVEEIVGPDEFAYRLARGTPERAALQAGRLAVQRRNELLRLRRSFAVETTISGHGHLPLIEEARRDGWRIGVVYIGLGSAELGIERVRERVRQGGHDVPAEDVRRRYHRSLHNLAINTIRAVGRGGTFPRSAPLRLLKVFGTKLVCDISPEDIRAYQTRRLSAGVSARTVNIEVGALRALLKAHRLWGPISDAVEMLRERKDVGRALDYEDERKLIDSARKSRSPVLLPLLTVTLDTGLRAAEIRSLRRKDLSLVWRNGFVESGFITVPKSKTEAGTGRTIPLSRRSCAALTLWLSRFPEASMETFVFPRHSIGLVGHKRKPHLFGVQFNQPIGQWKKAWKDACTAAKIRYRWHDLRHTFITRLAERPEISEQTIMSLAGHVSRSMLTRYSHIRSQAKQEAIEALERAALAAVSAIDSPQKSPRSDLAVKSFLN